MPLINPISQEQRMKVSEDLAKGVEPNLSFFVMVLLSTIIATYGLLVNNVAIVIGAMLLAPLMTPVLAFSLAMIKGDTYLMRKALEAEAKGILLTVAVAVFLTLLSPRAEITTEIIARTKPSLFDLLISIAAGVAATYIITQEGMGTFLPQVVIAILLVPPLAVVGVGTALRVPTILGGSLLLFITNLVAIIFGSSITFWFRGFIPYWSIEAHAEIKKKIWATVFILILVATPLSYVMYQVISRTRAQSTIHTILVEQTKMVKGARIANLSFSEEKGTIHIAVDINSPEEFDLKLAKGVKNILEHRLKKKVNLRINVIPFKEISLE